MLPRLTPYLREEYLGTWEQGMAAYILSNMYFILEEQPGPQLTDTIYQLLAKGSKEVV